MRQREKWPQLRSSDVIVLPALHEEKGIVRTVEYLYFHGVEPGQVILVNSCMDPEDHDGTTFTGQEILRQLGDENARGATIVSQYDMLGPGSVAWQILQYRFGFAADEICRGKGAAMYAAVLAMQQWAYDSERRVFFLDTDLVNLESADPIGSLLLAWERDPGAKLVKLGFVENSGFSAFLNLLPHPYCEMVQISWPLCGQQGILLGDIATMPLPTGYCVEYAIMASILEQHGITAFAEEAITETLRQDDDYDQAKYVKMHTGIYLFAQQFASRISLTTFRSETGRVSLHEWNKLTAREVLIGIPRSPYKARIVLDRILPDARNMSRYIERA